MDELWRSLDASRLVRTKHVLSCLQCKALFDGAATSTDDDYLVRVVNLVRKHIRKSPAPKGPACSYSSGCILEEKIDRTIGMEMIDVVGVRPYSDVRGVKVATINLEVRKDDHPDGFDMTRQDVAHRYFIHLKPSAGYIYFRFGPKETKVHVCVSPAYVSRREDITDAPTIEDILNVHKTQVPKISEWVLRKYRGLKLLVGGGGNVVETSNEAGKV